MPGSLLHVGKLATYENTAVSHPEVKEIQLGRDCVNAVMKANVSETQRKEAYRKFDSLEHTLAKQLDTEAYNVTSEYYNTADTQRNEAYGVFDLAHDQQHEVVYATIT